MFMLLYTRFSRQKLAFVSIQTSVWIIEFYSYRKSSSVIDSHDWWDSSFIILFQFYFSLLKKSDYVF